MALKPHWVEDRKMTPEAIEASLAADAVKPKHEDAPAKKPRGKAKKKAKKGD